MLRRFLIPRSLVSLLCLLRFRALVSPRAEVELAPGLELGRGVRIGSFTKLKVGEGRCRIGDRTSIATGGFFSAGTAGIEIGEDCLIGPNVVVVGSRYRYQDPNQPLRLQGHVSEGVRIGSNVWLCSGSCVTDGVEIGSGVIVSPNSVVTSDLPANAIAKGDPAEVVYVRK